MAALSLSMNPNVAHADEKVNPNPATNAIPLQDNPTANATESQKKTGTEKGSLDVTVNHDKLDKAVEEAKTAGVTVVEAPAKEKTVASDKVEEAKKEVEADYKAQETKVKEATDKYKEEVAKRDGKVKIVEKINKEKQAKYQADLAEVKKKEEALKAKGVFVDNDQVTVYGKLDETKRGSLDYYSDLSVVFKNKENNLETVKDGLGATAETTLELVDKIKVDTARENLLLGTLQSTTGNSTGGHILTGIEKGSTFILHNVGKTNSGKTISAKLTSRSTPTPQFPLGNVNRGSNTSLWVWWDKDKIQKEGKSEVGFNPYNYLNVEWDIEYFDEATKKPLNLGTVSIYADVDWGQTLRHTYNNENNVGTVINPPGSQVVEIQKNGKTYWKGDKRNGVWDYDDPTGLDQYRAGDSAYGNVKDVAATPEGTIVSIGSGAKHGINYNASEYVRSYSDSQMAAYRAYYDRERDSKGLPRYSDEELYRADYAFQLWGGKSVINTIVKPPKPETEAIPSRVEPPTVNVQYTNLKTNVKIEKHVKNSKGEDVNNHSVPKLAEVVWELEAKPLAAGREKTTKLGYVDDLPKGYQLNLEKVKAQNSEFDITYNSATHSLTASVKEAGLEKANKDLNKPYTIPTLKLYGTVMNDAATYTNNYHLNVNNKFDVYSNTVTVTTPGDPDRPKDSKIKPVKVNYNKDKVKIDGKQVLAGSVNYYHINLDYDQYKGIKSGPDAIQKGFGAVDDYPEQALDLLPNEIKYVETESGKEVKGITAYQFKSIDEVKDAKVKAILESSKIKPKGAFQVFVADDAQSYYDNYVSKGISVTVIDPMRVKSAFSGNYENKAYQIDFGNGYEADLVKNNVVTPEPHKKNLNSKGVDINGKSVLAGTVNHYHVTADYSKYKGIVVEKDRLAKGLFVVDDYPEEAVDIETNNIKIVDSKGKAVEGVTSKVYKSLAEAPKLVQDALKEQGYAPKGAFQVFTPNNMEDYFKKYVVTGETLTYIVPMKVKAEMAKTGGKYENTAYQLDFGSAKVTETVVNTVPKLETKKDVIIKVGDTESKDGKEIALGQKFYYSFDGSVITANRAEDLFEYKFVDDYQETHDRFDGVYKVIAKKDFKTADGKEFKKGDDLTSYSFLKEDKNKGQLEVGLKEEFLRSITNDSEFQAEVFVEMTRIMSGEVENKQTHVVNGVEVESNTVKTTTPTPPTPEKPTPKTPETPTPKPQTPAKKVLPNTGADASVLGIVMAGITSALGAIGLKRKRD
jgi:adhesin isopeptide-forming family sspB-C2 type protein/LPXTG-motif cell wall-anchored protein